MYKQLLDNHSYDPALCRLEIVRVPLNDRIK